MTQIFIVTFIILTLLHPIADYMISKEKRIPWHYFLALNPLHFIWDESLGKMHSHYTYKINFLADNEEVIEEEYWFWLGIDQLVHVMLNLLFAVFLEAIL